MEGHIASPVNVHVLLVDDERVSRILISNALKRCGYSVTAVDGGREAIKFLQENPRAYNLVLSDVMMPGVDGIQLLKAIRGSQEFDAVPVVMISSNDNESTAYECISNGAEDYLLKPVTKKEVQYIWQHAWRRQSQCALKGKRERCEGSGGASHCAKSGQLTRGVPVFEGLSNPLPLDTHVRQPDIVAPHIEHQRSGVSFEPNSRMEGHYGRKNYVAGSAGPSHASGKTSSVEAGTATGRGRGLGQEVLSSWNRSRRSASEPAASGGNTLEHDAWGGNQGLNDPISSRVAGYGVPGTQPSRTMSTPSPFLMNGAPGQMRVPHPRWLSGGDIQKHQPSRPAGDSSFMMQSPAPQPRLPSNLMESQVLGPVEHSRSSSGGCSWSTRGGASLQVVDGKSSEPALGNNQMGAFVWSNAPWLDHTKAEEARSDLKLQHSAAGGRIQRGPMVAAERSWSLSKELQKQQEAEEQLQQQQTKGSSLVGFRQFLAPSASAPQQLLLEQTQQWVKLCQTNGEDFQGHGLLPREKGPGGSEQRVQAEEVRANGRSRGMLDRGGLNGETALQKMEWDGRCQRLAPWGQALQHYQAMGVTGCGLTCPTQCVRVQQDWAVVKQLPDLHMSEGFGAVGGELGWSSRSREGEGVFAVAQHEQMRYSVDAGDQSGGNPDTRSEGETRLRNIKGHNALHCSSQAMENVGRIRTTLGAGGAVRGRESLLGRSRTCLGIGSQGRIVGAGEGGKDVVNVVLEGASEQSQHATSPTAGRVMTMREWLCDPGRVVNRVECLHIVLQVLRLLNELHSQGLCMQHLRPSSIALLEDGTVSFLEPETMAGEKEQGGIVVASCGNEDQNEEERMSGVVVGESSIHLGKASGCSRFAKEERQIVRAGGGEDGEGMTSLSEDEEVAVKGEDSMEEDGDEQQMRNSYRVLEPICGEEVQLAERAERLWYVSPEELKGAPASTATDMYSLGVLFFELFYPWTMLEEQVHIMADLRHRILPPAFMSECPKEAAFCLWLLHPEPSSRPTAKDALGCELMNKAQMAVAMRQEMLERAEEEREMDLLHDFLSRLQDVKSAAAAKLEGDIRRLTADIKEVERRQLAVQGASSGAGPSALLAPTSGRASRLSRGSRKRSLHDSYEEVGSTGNGVVGPSYAEAEVSGHRSSDTTERQRRSERVHMNFKHLEEAYFSTRWKRGVHERGGVGGDVGRGGTEGNGDVVSGTAAAAGAGASGSGSGGQGGGDLPRPLGCFYDSLCKFVRYSRFEVKATLRYGDLLNTSNMVCSLSFDKDDQFFATAGVCKRVKIFECDAVLNDSADIHYPVCEMASRSKLSCVCWNSYIKSHIASSDYEGHVQLWDASTSQPVVEYEEHEKRVWSVDFSRLDPKHLASGSDDGTVKLWSISQESSAATIRTKANVCCVQFSPGSAHTLAFGSADYKLYTYDLRHPRVPLAVFGGHGRAVSYVKFADANTLVSASTDNTLKIWDLQKGIDDRSAGISVSTNGCINTFMGHTNEKNFVGLTVADGYMACGSETNSVFAYHQTLPMPMASHRFGATDPVTGVESDDDAGQFVSSVCWRGNTRTLVAANSMGNIKVLEMV